MSLSKIIKDLAIVTLSATLSVEIATGGYYILDAFFAFNGYSDSVQTKITKDFKDGKIYVNVKEVSYGTVPNNKVGLKLNNGKWITRESGNATFTIDCYRNNLRNGTNTIYTAVFDKKKPDNYGSYINDFRSLTGREVVNHGSPASFDIFTWFPVIKVNKVIRRDDSHLEAIVNVSDKECDKKSTITVDASSDGFKIDKVKRKGSLIDYFISFREKDTGHLYIDAKASNGLKSRARIPLSKIKYSQKVR